MLQHDFAAETFPWSIFVLGLCVFLHPVLQQKCFGKWRCCSEWSMCQLKEWKIFLQASFKVYFESSYFYSRVTVDVNVFIEKKNNIFLSSLNPFVVRIEFHLSKNIFVSLLWDTSSVLISHNHSLKIIQLA